MMTSSTHPLTGVPGLVGARLDAGVWRSTARADRLLDTMSTLLVDRHGELFLVAGEDRGATGEIAVHYLIATRQFDASPRQLIHIEATLDRNRPELPSLAALSFPASRFEREMRDLFGVMLIGHPDSRPLVRHAFWPETFHPLRVDSVIPDFTDDGRPFPFTAVEGEGVYEIPVGPVHAGVIEPGHFRFNVLGETILKMRARLYFTHKGTERLFQGRAPSDGVALAERISGDTSVGHAVAYCQALEALAGASIPSRAAALRTILLELERWYNHVADVGAIIGDTGFGVGQAHCLRIRETLLRLNQRLTGHRLLRGVITPGGVTDVRWPDSTLMDDLRRVGIDFDEVVDICLENTLVQDRLDETGRLPVEVARDFGVVGYVARACGVADDMRVDLPTAAYTRVPVTPAIESTGDVRARLMVRIREVHESLVIIERTLALSHASDALRQTLGVLTPHTPAFGIVEAWRGRLVHLVIADDAGRLARVKVVDPSFFNWPALARALEGNIVPDFPLCNKSFNQSYSGNDL